MIVIKIAVSFMTKLDKTLVLDEPIALAKKNAVDQSALMSNGNCGKSHVVVLGAWL